MKNNIKIGFTLLELLFVVALIAILAAIGVPNFLEAQIRAKVSRARSDMAIITTGLESYRLDHHQYPYAYEKIENDEYLSKYAQSIQPFIPNYNMGMDFPSNSIDIMTTSSISYSPAQLKNIDEIVSETKKRLADNNIRYSPISQIAFSALTTPLSYCPNSVFTDIFHHEYGQWNAGKMPYKYINMQQIKPEGLDIEKIGKNIPYLLFSVGPHGTFNPYPFEPVSEVNFYDPTNGTISSGFLYHWGK